MIITIYYDYSSSAGSRDLARLSAEDPESAAPESPSVNIGSIINVIISTCYCYYYCTIIISSIDVITIITIIGNIIGITRRGSAAAGRGRGAARVGAFSNHRH